MRRVIPAGLLALPAVLFVGPTAQAQYVVPPPGCSALPVVRNPHIGCSHAGCGGFCFRLFPGLHQEGPLFNYGPYYGYYPFEPYGPWTADLRYTGPTGADCGGRGCGACGRCRGLFGLGGWNRGCGDGGCGHWGGYAKSTFHNVKHRLHPFSHHKCKACGGGEVTAEAAADCPGCVAGAAAAAAIAVEPTTVQAAAELPAVEAGYPRRER